MTVLHNAAVVRVGDDTTYVDHALAELVALLDADVVGASAPLEGYDAVVVVGRDAADALGLPGSVTEDDPGRQGYVIEVVERDGVPCVLVAGSDPQGTKFALLDLIRNTTVDERGARLPDGFSRRTKPFFGVRGMYAHLHWAYDHPYALRSWTYEDWTDYVDLLSHFGANLLQIWPMLSLMPHPLSEQDEAYLTMLARVVDYAHEAQGMQVFVGECANNLAATDHGQPITERQYFDTERLVDPGTPEGMAEILASRRDMYRILANADGYWLIDSDPGQWPGSPSSDFVEVFVQNQRLAKEYNPDAQMFYWMHVGWGTETMAENFRAILAGLEERLEEPWSILLGGIGGHVDAARDVGVLDRAVWFPYGVVEGEPRNPLTQFNFEFIDEYLTVGVREGVTRGMAQAQTPIVQLPKIWYMLQALWDPGVCDRPPEPLLDELAALLYPESADAVAAAWRAMCGRDAAQLADARDGLRKAIAAGLGRPGPVGAKLFGRPEIVAEDLAMLVHIKAEAEAFCQAVHDERPPATVQEHFCEYLRAALRWTSRHNYIPMGGTKYVYGPYLEPAAEGWTEYVKRHGVMHAYPEVLWVPKNRLIAEGEFHWAMVDGLLTEIISPPRKVVVD